MIELRRQRLKLETERPFFVDGSTSVTFGTMLNGMHIALKSIVCENDAEASLREAMNQARLEHPHICKLYDCFLERSGDRLCVNLIIERLDTDLKREIDSRQRQGKRWSEDEIILTISGLVSALRALSFAQVNSIAHRDVKPENILLSSTAVKIGDFGVSCDQSSFSTLLDSHYPGTPPYFSPELRRAESRLIREGAYTPIDYFKSDVYSLGVVGLMMALLHLPPGMQDLRNLSKVRHDSLELVGSSYPRLRKLLEKMLAIEVADRLSFAELESYIQFSTPLVPLDRPACAECKLAIESTDWTSSVPQELRAYSSMFPKVCGLKCLRAHQQKFGSQTCAVCQTTFHATASGVIRLSCEHFLDSQECLFLCMKQTTENFSLAGPFLCPSCGFVLSKEEVEQHFDSEDLATRKHIAYSESCHICHTDSNLRFFKKCRHVLCRAHVLTVLWAEKCPFCSLWKRLTGIGGGSS